MTLNEYEGLTIQWSEDRGIIKNGKVSTQALKLVSEMGELCDNIAKGKDIKDDIGDCLVVLTNIAKMSGTNLTECWDEAWNDIKDRKGFLNEAGTFIKDTDKAYKQLKLDFDTNSPDTNNSQESDSNYKVSSVELVDIPSVQGVGYVLKVNTSDGRNTDIHFEIPNILSLNNQLVFIHGLVGKDIKFIRDFITNELKGEIK